MFLILLGFIIGLIFFPILFYIQNLLKILPPDLSKTNFHIHHSFYGVLLMVMGVAIFVFTYKIEMLGFFSLGLGFVIHHEVSEPGLKGLGKFIYFKRK